MKELIQKAINAIDEDKKEYAKGILETLMVVIDSDILKSPEQKLPYQPPSKEFVREMAPLPSFSHESDIITIANQGLYEE